jgi:hypothetical protein
MLYCALLPELPVFFSPMVPWDLTLTAGGQLCREWRAFCNVDTVIACRIWTFEQHMGHKLDFYPLGISLSIFGVIESKTKSSIWGPKI